MIKMGWMTVLQNRFPRAPVGPEEGQVPRGITMALPPLVSVEVGGTTTITTAVAISLPDGVMRKISMIMMDLRIYRHGVKALEPIVIQSPHDS